MRGFTLWVIGPSSSDNDALARTVEGDLLERGMRVEVLDAAATSSVVAGAEGAAFIAALLTRNDVVCVCSYPVPANAVREENRKKIGRYVEVLVKNPESADDASFEEPEKPEVVCDLAEIGEEEALVQILKTLEILGFIPPSDLDDEYSEEDEDKIRQRLQDLGYI